MHHPLQDRVVLLLINGMSVQSAETFCLQNGADAATARQVVAAARQKITVAADYARDEQLGKAVIRLDDLYAKSIAGHDIRTALQAQRELNRLLSLYTGKDRSDAADDASPEGEDVSALRQSLELIAAYLRPLGLVDPAYPVEEHARVAAEIIRQHGLSTLSAGQGTRTGP